MTLIGTRVVPSDFAYFDLKHISPVFFLNFAALMSSIITKYVSRNVAKSIICKGPAIVAMCQNVRRIRQE